MLTDLKEVWLTGCTIFVVILSSFIFDLEEAFATLCSSQLVMRSSLGGDELVCLL